MSGVFTYSNPPVIRWGARSLAGLGAELDRLGAARVALVTTRSLLANPELMGTLKEALGERGPVSTSLIGQHAPVADIDAAAAAVAKAGAGGVVSFGGGSPIDAAKVVAIRTGDARGDARPLPHVAIPTTLSAAELSSGAGMTSEQGDKAGLRDPRGMPDAVIYDASLALHTPMPLWLSSGIRALDHAVEGFLADGDHPLSDVLALEAVRRLFRTLPQAQAQPRDGEVRTVNQLAAWFSYTLPAAGNGLSHVMGKQIGARHHIPHGVTSCLLLPHVLRYRARWQLDRMAPLALAAGGDGSIAQQVEQLIGSLGLPQQISEFGLGPPELRRAADEVAQTFGGKYQADELFAIYLAAL